MQITLFKALKSISIDDASATAVVDQLEDHVETMISNAIKPLEAQNKALESKIDSLRNQLTFTNVLLAIIGLGIVAAPIIAKLVH